MRTSFRRATALTAITVVLGALSASPAPGLAAPPPAVTFNPNLLLPGSGGAAEPSIRTNSKGESFVIGPTGSQCQAMRVAHNGATAKFIGAPDHNAGGGDCDWAIGPKETAVLPGLPSPTADDLAFSSLDNLVNITTGKSSDDGNSFLSPNPASTQVVGDDRMWMAADPKPNSAGFDTIFMTYHDVSLVDIQLSLSTDGGFAYVQSGPIINTSDAPQGQWQGLGALSGNELGNIVARRDPLSGKLTLYSIFATPDSAADNVTQGAAGTTNFNRLYEAVGSVTDPTPPNLVPTVSWRNYEIFHGQLGKRFNRIFPVNSVDSTGRVYAFWSDGNHIFTKSNATGITWDPTVDGTPIPNFGGDNTAIMPWADALAQGGAPGVVDAVFYGAHGGSGAQPNPQDDANNVWNAYMAQSVDGGATWTTSKASDHDIHTSQLCIDGLNCNLFGNRDRTLLDFFQIAIDPTNGAADIAFADDHASHGSAVLYYTRQCTGISAKTGQLLVNDCKAPPPPPQPPMGTVCPGPQILDFINDAPNNYPGGMGQNLDNLDIVSGTFKSAAGGTSIDITLMLKNLQAPPTVANPNIISALWSVYFQYNNADAQTWWFVRATSNGSGSTAVVVYDYGSWKSGTFHRIGAINGEFHPGPLGTIVYHLPRANIGGPPDGALLTSTWADTHGSPGLVLGNGVYYTATADRAPDANFGANHIVGTPPCPGGGGGGGCREADGNGNVQGKNGGNASFQSDEDGCIDGDQDGEQMSDAGAKEDFRSTAVQSVQFDNALGTMTVYGLGVSNGLPVSFLIVEQAATAATPAFYSIELSDGYVNSGNLTVGTITLR
jgi:hypothetical protein